MAEKIIYWKRELMQADIFVTANQTALAKSKCKCLHMLGSSPGSCPIDELLCNFNKSKSKFKNKI